MNFKLFTIAAATSLTLSACGGSGGGGPLPSPSPAPTPTMGPSPTPTPTPTPTMPPQSFLSCDGSLCTLSGIIDEDFTLDAARQWRIDGVVQVGEGNVTVASDADVQAIKDAGVTLTVEPGVHVRAFDDATLLVTRGSKLMANGTATNPITFSSLDADFDGTGEWGGVVIQGFAPQFGAGNTGPCFGTGTICNVEGEGGDFIGVFGGNDPADDSGVVRYVRIAEGGRIAGPNNEVNGLTLQGVGHATELEYIQVHNNLDDGIEWFGGTVNLRYAVLTGNDDDDLDFDEGYQGNIQYAIIKKSDNAAPQGSNDPRGIEANSSDEDFVPQTEAVIANVLLLGGAVNNAAGLEQPGMRLRGSLTTSIFNTAVNGFDTGCIRIDDSDTNGDGTVDSFSTVNLTNVIGDCMDGFYDRRAADEETNAMAADFSLDDALAIAEAVGQLGSAPTITAVANGSSFMFDATDYIGAVEPGTPANEAWWAGWTIPGTLGEVNEPVQAADFVTCNTAETVCTVTGVIDEDYTFVRGVQWQLDGVVRVGSGNVTVADDADVQAIKDAGVTLTIRSGVDIRAFDDATLLVTRGSKLMAEGTRANPITFSSLDANFDGLGEWGGVVIQGFAPQFGAGNTGPCFGTGTICNVQGEGGDFIGVFGGNDPADDSGVVRYVRIAEGGRIAGPNNEVNGLTLQGVGHATELEYIQVHNNLDDGIEWFGGTVNLRYAVLTGNDDDDLDFDEGYQGNIQYAIIKKSDNAAPQGSNDPRGIEANSSDEDFVPQTEAVIANVLLLGGAVNNAAGLEQPGMRLRGSLTTSIFNTAVNGFDTGCIRIDDSDTNGDGTADSFSTVNLTNVIGACTDGFYDRRMADAEAGTVGAQMFSLDAAIAIAESVGQLASAPTITPVDNGSSFMFDATDYIGAVEPGTAAADAWWAGWTLTGTLP
jgi:hypothetical protein